MYLSTSDRNRFADAAKRCNRAIYVYEEGTVLVSSIYPPFPCIGVFFTPASRFPHAL